MKTPEDTQAASQLELRVLNGIHQGAALLLVDDAIVVGSHTDCDVVLLDDGVADRHLKVFRQDGVWVCTPIDNAPVLAADNKPAAPDQIIAPGMRFLIADVWIGFSEILSPWAPLRSSFEMNAPPDDPRHERVVVTASRDATRSYKLLWATAGFALLCCGLVGATLLFDTPAQSAEPPKPPAIPAAIAAAAEKSKGPGANQLRDAARAVLQDHRIDAKVRVISSPGRLFLEGELTSDERARFEQSLLILQRQFGATTLIEAALTPVSTKLPFRVHQIVMGADSYILLDNEYRMYVGDRVSGFQLAAVQSGRLLFHGKHTVEVPW